MPNDVLKTMSLFLICENGLLELNLLTLMNLNRDLHYENPFGLRNELWNC